MTKYNHTSGEANRNRPTIPLPSAGTVEDVGKNAKKSQRGGRPTLPMDEAKRVLEKLRWLHEHRFDGNATRLGAAIGVSQEIVSKWLAGMSSPGIQNLDAIARQLDTTEYQLRKGALGDLDICLAYNEKGRWSDRAIAKARRLAAELTEEGRTLSPKTWEERLNALAEHER